MKAQRQEMVQKIESVKGNRKAGDI